MFWHLSIASLLAGTALATKHRLFTSSLSQPNLYTLEYDDAANSLVSIANITGNAVHPWLSFSYDKASLYASERGGFSSYTVAQGQDLVFAKSLNVAGQAGCANAAGKTAKYISSLARVPFSVFGSLDGTCGVGIGVDYSGAFTNIDQTFSFSPSSGIGGMVLDPDNRYLYSADEAANGIWVHSVSDMGQLKQLGFVSSPWADAGPKRLAVHTDGRFLYVLFSKLNRIGVYAVNVGLPESQALITYTGVSYGVIPPNVNNAEFAAESIYVSAESNILFATARYRAETGSRNTQSGYLRAILLTSLAETDNPIEDRAVGSGFPIRPILQIQTRSGGGISNIAYPAPWSNEHIAVADSAFGRVEIWKLDGLQNINYAGALAQGALTPPKGGWVAKAWRPNGNVKDTSGAAPTTAPKSTTGPPPPRPDRAQFGNPEAAKAASGAAGAPRPNRPPTNGAPRSRTTVYASAATPAPKSSARPFPRPKSTGDEDDDDRRRARQVEETTNGDASGVLRKRQFQFPGFPGADAPGPAIVYSKVTARVVAQWQAPTRSGCCSNALWFD